MKYHFSKSKFSNQLFFKSIQSAVLEHKRGVIEVSVNPHIYYSGRYHIYLVVQKDKKRTLYLAMKSQEDEVNFEELNRFNNFLVSLSHDGKKAMFISNDTKGIVLKS